MPLPTELLINLSNRFYKYLVPDGTKPLKPPRQSFVVYYLQMQLCQLLLIDFTRRIDH